MARSRVGEFAIAVLVAVGAVGCGGSPPEPEPVTTTDYSQEAAPTTPAHSSDAPPEVNQAVLDYGRNIYRRLAQGNPTFTGPRDVDAAYCNSAGQSGYGDPLYECYYTYNGGTEQTPVKTWSWQGNAGAIPEDGDWSQ